MRPEFATFYFHSFIITSRSIHNNSDCFHHTAIGEELLFFGNGPLDVGSYPDHENFDPSTASFGIPLSILPSLGGSEHGSYAESETTKTHSLASSRESRSANYTV